jgi:hypothetical protein
VSDPGQPADENTLSGRVWSVIRLPVQIVLTGLSILLLVWISTRFTSPAFAALGSLFAGNKALPAIIALLLFVVGLSFAGFLCWVVGRYFTLISSPKMTPDLMSSLKELPMGLPEGTIRSVLALIVAVVGLPLIVFGKFISMDDNVAGYLNGIITGVFGFYFGTRSSGSATRALNQIADAKSQASQAVSQRDAAVAAAAGAASLAAATARAAGFGGAVSKLNRELGVASTVLNVIAPALPAGILPAGLSNAVSTAQSALNAVQGVTQDTVTDVQTQGLQDALGTVMGSGNSSALGSLIKTAAPMLSSIGIPGVGEVTALVALLSVGMKLGSQAYARWRARVLAAPLAHGLLEFGTVTPDDAQAAMLDAPLFAKAFAEERDRQGFFANLADAVLRDDAIERLWQSYGTAIAGKPAIFATRAELEAGLAEFDQALLASQSAADMPDGLPDVVTHAMTQAKDPAMRSLATTTLTRDNLNQIVNAASKASATATASAPAGAAPNKAHAAFDALITLVGHSRETSTDLVGSMAEVVT